jgi:hypothetical protein
MAQKPKTFHRSPSRRFGFVKETGKSKRWRNETNPDFARGETISDRKMSGLSREARTGEKLSKERYTREVKSGARKYIGATELRQRHAKDAHFIKQFVPEMTPSDKQVAYQWLDLKRNGKRGADGHTAGALTEKEQGRFHRLFTRYNRNDIRQLFGSEAKDIGQFGIAA